jgi:hypothetical protein
VEIPKPIRHADQTLHRILEGVSFSRHLNPTNVQEARQAFNDGAETPPFVYHPLHEADDLLKTLDAVEPPRDHPAGEIVGECINSIRRLIVALKSRSTASFDEMNEKAGWYPTPELLKKTYPSGSPTQPLDVSATKLIACFETAFLARGMNDWSIVPDSVMSARVLVDSAKRIVRINPKSRFRKRDIQRLIVHEIDVHAWRATNGQKQILHCFSTGLPGSLATEEGLAMVAEETSGTESPGVLQRQSIVVKAIDLARRMGFRELYETLCIEVGSGLAWGICLRVKRGLANPNTPGVYAKDSVYLSGRNAVRGWLDNGGDIRKLYVGKVSIHDPIDEWIDQGWIKIQPIPTFWTDQSA